MVLWALTLPLEGRDLVGSTKSTKAALEAAKPIPGVQHRSGTTTTTRGDIAPFNVVVLAVAFSTLVLCFFFFFFLTLFAPHSPDDPTTTGDKHLTHPSPLSATDVNVFFLLVFLLKRLAALSLVSEKGEPSKPEMVDFLRVGWTIKWVWGVGSGAEVGCLLGLLSLACCDDLEVSATMDIVKLKEGRGNELGFKRKNTRVNLK